MLTPIGDLNGFAFGLPLCLKCNQPVMQTQVLEYQHHGFGPTGPGTPSNSYEVLAVCHGEVGAHWFKDAASFAAACKPYLPLVDLFPKLPGVGFGTHVPQRPKCRRCDKPVEDGMVIANPISSRAVSVDAYCHGEMQRCTVHDIGHHFLSPIDAMQVMDFFPGPRNVLRVVSGSSTHRNGSTRKHSHTEIDLLNLTIEANRPLMPRPVALVTDHFAPPIEPPFHPNAKCLVVQDLALKPKTPAEVFGTLKMVDVNFEAFSKMWDGMGGPTMKEVLTPDPPTPSPKATTKTCCAAPFGHAAGCPKLDVPVWRAKKVKPKPKRDACVWCNVLFSDYSDGVVTHKTGKYHFDCWTAFDDRAKRGRKAEPPADLRKRRISVDE